MTKTGVRMAAGVLLLAALGACGGSSAASRRDTVRAADSAGVRIVTNLSGSIDSADVWFLSDTPVAGFGSEPDGDVTLSDVTAVRPLGDGRVAVGMNRPPRVLLLGPGGRAPTRIGEAGKGPGEFTRVSSVLPLGVDSLAVWDPDRRRMSVFTAEGAFVREADLSEVAPGPPPDVSATSGTSRILPTASGSLVVFGLGIFDGRRGVKRPEVPSYRVTPAGRELASYGPIPGLETYLGPRGGAWVVFGASTSAATLGDAFVVGTARAPEFRVYAPSGDLEKIVRWPDHDRSVSGRLVSEWSDFVDARLASVPEGRRARLRKLLGELPRADAFPAYGTLLASDAGRVWVGEYPGQLALPGILPGSARMPELGWLVFDSAGAIVAGLHTPRGFDPRAVRGDRVWGVFTDRLGVESVRAYGISRP